MKQLLTYLIFILVTSSAIAKEGHEDGVAAYREGDYAKALRIFQVRANDGYGNANFMLSMMYANGQGVPADSHLSKEHALLAAQRDEPAAFGIVATLYFGGKFGQPDVAKGFEWLNKGVAKYDANSMRMLALRLALGHDISAAPERAFRIMKDCSANLKDHLCTVELAKMYEYGIGTKISYSLARSNYEKILGGPSNCRIGRLYELGLGVTQNSERAYEYYLAAAKNNQSGEAMTSLGLMHEKGLGVPADPRQAAALYEKAADFGDPNGLVQGGRLHLEGAGFKHDSVEATRWFKEAADLKYPKGLRMLAARYALGDGVASNKALALTHVCHAAIIEDQKSEISFENSNYAVGAQATINRLATLRICRSYGVPKEAADHLEARMTTEDIAKATEYETKLKQATDLSIAMTTN